ncbi:hypothetical protein BDK51DRAFT_38661 [Blyttiomyces helicus]|uniref:SH3 domain-containing protein n=1 Tax=Blyttiomyces helicus TaxID=388810 RepID=A0A4P9VZR3_9FUNG|nr:hypothetical protein BDK51DRAFT_38661 [Blyttiomyces helicus]|eukprot:RKO83326.1 hypothetical protein BDK51DRAFT_38661 [Blyttiomyces helicus]
MSGDLDGHFMLFGNDPEPNIASPTACEAACVQQCSTGGGNSGKQCFWFKWKLSPPTCWLQQPDSAPSSMLFVKATNLTVPGATFALTSGNENELFLGNSSGPYSECVDSCEDNNACVFASWMSSTCTLIKFSTPGEASGVVTGFSFVFPALVSPAPPSASTSSASQPTVPTAPSNSNTLPTSTSSSSTSSSSATSISSIPESTMPLPPASTLPLSTSSASGTPTMTTGNLPSAQTPSASSLPDSTSSSSGTSTAGIAAGCISGGILIAVGATLLLRYCRRKRKPSASTPADPAYFPPRLTMSPARQDTPVIIAEQDSFSIPPAYGSVPASPVEIFAAHRVLPHDGHASAREEVAFMEGEGVPGNIAVARADHTPKQEDELALCVGDKVDVVQVLGNGWASGRRVADGQVGLFPYAAVTSTRAFDP